LDTSPRKGVQTRATKEIGGCPSMTSPFDWKSQPAKIDRHENGNLQAVRKKLAMGISQNSPQLTFTKKGQSLAAQRKNDKRTIQHPL
jgi:hypothetical protein